MKKKTSKQLVNKVMSYDLVKSDQLIDHILTSKIATKLKLKEKEIREKLLEAVGDVQDDNTDEPPVSKIQGKGSGFYQIINTDTTPSKKIYVNYQKTPDSGVYSVDYYDYANANSKVVGVKYALNVGTSQFPDLMDSILNSVYEFTLSRKSSVNKILFLPKGVFTKEINIRLSSVYSKYVGKFKSIGYNIDRSPGKDSAFWVIGKSVSSKSSVA